MSNNLPSPPPPATPVAERADGPASSVAIQPPSGPAEWGEPESGLNLRRIIAALLRYKWLALLVVLIGTGAGIVLVRFVDLQYVAQVNIWIEVTQREAADRGPIQSGQLLRSYAWLDLLRSYEVLDPVVIEQRLYLETRDPADAALFADFRLGERFRPGSYRLLVGEDGRRVTLAAVEAGVLEEAAVGDSLGRELGFLWLPPAAALTPRRSVEFSVQQPRDMSRRLRGEIRTSMQENGNFLWLELGGTNPEQITATLNAIAHRYVDLAAELKSVKLREIEKILWDQLVYAEQNLRDADNELELFRVRTITLPTERASPVTPGLAETRDPAFENFFALKIEQEQLRRDREAIEEALPRAGDAELPVAALEYVGSAQRSTELMRALQELTAKRAELRGLRAVYTDEHIQVRRIAGEVETLERQTVPRLARSLIAQIDARDAQIERMVRSVASELQRIPPRVQEEAQLRRKVAIAEQLYGELRQRYETASLAAASSVPDVRILSEATVPRIPYSDQRPRLLIMAFMGSLGLAVVGAVVLDRIDRRVRYPEQITRGLRLSILGAVPHVKGRGGREDTMQVLEAFRELRLSVVHAYGAAGPLVATITSPGSGDGKSFLSANLALSFAEQGHRTLLIDGDIRRGGQHRLLGATRKPGLTDLLAGDATRQEVIQDTSYPLLSLIACGTRRREGPELLGSPTMSQLMRELRSSYSVILVDSPPLGAGVDPFILGTMTGHIVVVLRTGYTDREFAEAKLDLMDRLPVRILGAVMNAVPADGVYRYYSYLPGYEAQNEDVVEEGRLVPGI